MTTHYLKTDAPWWEAVKDGRKNFEIRRNDRGYQAGDVLVLCRQEGYGGACVTATCKDHDHERLSVRVTYVYSGMGLDPAYVVLGFEHFGAVKAQGGADHDNP